MTDDPRKSRIGDEITVTGTVRTIEDLFPPCTPTTKENLMTEATDRVLADIRAERARHSEIGYDQKHDDGHDLHDLVEWSKRYASKAGKKPGALPGLYDRQRLVQSASLMVSAIEYMDRIDSE